MRFKIILCVALAIILQWSLGGIFPELRVSYVDFPIIVITYFALRRDVAQAIIIGCVAGLAIDALSGSLLGAGGFSKTLTAFLLTLLANRVMLDNQLMRVPVLAGAVLVSSSILVGLQKFFGFPPRHPFSETLAYSIISTTIVGTVIFYFLDLLFSSRVKIRREFATRRRSARRRS